MPNGEREAVEGFTWKRFNEVNLELLIPNSWFTKEAVHLGVPNFTASREAVGGPLLAGGVMDPSAKGYTV